MLSVWPLEAGKGRIGAASRVEARCANTAHSARAVARNRECERVREQDDTGLEHNRRHGSYEIE